ncbi:transcriptional repressor TCF25-domain-containing protein [Sphaerosporella brunnea]|uniref:Transcriptional repressor TCF25-domain-containing protein n=1 Tax=Sphaerosporella brunnea TaxID=1250544 RepID=A0A5J5F340_9PEZI|nr:transcriptional repressor TCF25-domain-containing protein [Sphaerosporella brunnea]
MSGRAVRKALRQREAELLRAQASDEASEESDEPAPPKPSLFALLNIADERDEQDDDGEDEEELEPAREPPKPIASAKKSKKKKKAKGKGKAKKEEDGEDDIDRALRQLNIASPGTSTPASGTSTRGQLEAPLSAVLKVDSRNLDASNEMMKLFGRHALRSTEEIQGTAAAGARRGGGMRMMPAIAGGRALAKGRKNTFVQPKEEWPNAGSGGLGMEIDDSDMSMGVTTYKFVHSRQYQGVQRQFAICVASMDPQRLLQLLHYNPYHITTLLQCSEIFHHQRDFTIAGDLLERALFSLGRSLHSSFQQKLAEGTARLSFRRPENRELFLCCWRYIKNLSLRGTWRTAEEFARLLFAMDPEGDSYEMCLLIDFLALKARQPERFLELAEHPALRKKFSDLPNMAFSSALAQLQLGNESLASEYLSKAITKFPWLPTMMYQEFNLGAQLPPTLWGIPPPEDNPRQEILARLYVERTKEIWTQPAFKTFLVDICSSIYNLPPKPLLANASPEVSLSLARHVILTEIQPLIQLLPRSLTTRPTAAYDPFPPDDDLRSYSATFAGPGVSEMIVDNRYHIEGVFTTFFRSILPWFRAGLNGQNIDGDALPEAERNEIEGFRTQLELAGINVPEMLQEFEREERAERDRAMATRDGDPLERAQQDGRG